MSVRLTWTTNSTGHDGTTVHRSTATMDPQALPTPIATLPAGATEYVDGEPLANGTYYYRVQDYQGASVSAASAEVSITIGTDWSAVAVGDEVEGGIYAGTDTIGGSEYHIISGDAASEAYGLEWDVTGSSSTPGTDSDTDGLANTQAMEAAGIANYPAAEHCVNYAGGGYGDWHMPARSQLTLMYNNLAGHAEFSDNTTSGDFTWASTEYSATYAWERKFSDGAENGFLKYSVSRRVRPVRRILA